MKVHQLYASQFLPIVPETAWAFFSDPKNLRRITPEHMGFHILSGADRPMYAGQVIQYKIAPFPGLTTTWVTEITHVEPGSYFVDEQRFGPYAFWHHKHFIYEVQGGVQVEDLVDYKLPMGFLGRWLNPLLVRPQLQKIFEFRAQKLTEYFGESHSMPATPLLKFSNP